MINQFGADAVRLFILSDSPPEKDVQWTDSGVASANKFLQKIWNLNFLISKRQDNKIDDKDEKKFKLNLNNFIYKIDNSIQSFRFNVSIALFYELYSYFKESLEFRIGSKLLSFYFIEMMKLMMPFTPHLSHECLENLGCKNVYEWPKIDKKNLTSEIKLAVQINGKTRDIITIKKDLIEKEIQKIVLNKSKAKKYIEDKKILKTIFVKNKILNYIITNK